MADDGFDEDPDIFGTNDASPVCDLCGAILDMTPAMAGKHPAVRLDCPEHGARLMWTPFGDDATWHARSGVTTSCAASA